MDECALTKESSSESLVTRSNRSRIRKRSSLTQSLADCITITASKRQQVDPHCLALPECFAGSLPGASCSSDCSVQQNRLTRRVSME
jgi:hypothetical protein